MPRTSKKSKTPSRSRDSESAVDGLRENELLLPNRKSLRNNLRRQRRNRKKRERPQTPQQSLNAVAKIDAPKPPRLTRMIMPSPKKRLKHAILLKASVVRASVTNPLLRTKKAITANLPVVVAVTKRAAMKKLPMTAEMPEMSKLPEIAETPMSTKPPAPATTETSMTTEVVGKKKDRGLLQTSITWVVKFLATPTDAVTHLEISSAKTEAATTSGGGHPTKLVRATATCPTLEKVGTPTSRRSTTTEVANVMVVTNNFQAKRAAIVVLPVVVLAIEVAVNSPFLATTQPHGGLRDPNS